MFNYSVSVKSNIETFFCQLFKSIRLWIHKFRISQYTKIIATYNIYWKIQFVQYRKTKPIDGRKVKTKRKCSQSFHSKCLFLKGIIVL